MLKVLETLDAATTEVNELLEKELIGHSSYFDKLVLPLVKAGGKRMRTRLCLLLAGAKTGTLTQDAYYLASAIEMLHLATLIHDDVLDEAPLRRGVATIHSLKGNKVAILSGDYLFARAFDMISRVPSTDFLPIFTEVIVSLVEGEFLQMADIDNLNQSIEEYLLKSKKKTADLVIASIEIGARLGGFSEQEIESFKKFGHALGMLFQITDDMLDYTSVASIAGKEAGQDIREGVITYPLLSILTEHNKGHIQELIHSISKTGNVDSFIQFVIREGGVDNTLELATQYAEEAKKSLLAVSEFAGKELLFAYVDSLIKRSK